VRRLVLVSIAARRDGSFPEVLAAMDAMSADIAPMMEGSPAHRHYAEHAPRPEDWTAHVGRTAELLKVDYDWTEEMAGLEPPTMLVYADADSVRPDHIVELWQLLGGGRRDAGWDGSARPQARLAILPGATHYDVHTSPLLVPAVLPFLDER
jgi:pimeloyl-ACP methyl ester carboxylesterase